jgi:aminoglycoside phosphotransferase (APT) family kinase protein
VSNGQEVEVGDDLDGDGLAAWLAATVDPAISSVTTTKLAGGHSSGAWRIDLTGEGSVRSLVLKAPEAESVVYRRDICREGRILDALHRAGAPVPAVVAIDADARALGRPSLVMELIPGRSPADASAGGYHDDPWLHGLGPDGQRAVWASFYDALARLHNVDASSITDARHGPTGLVDVVGYWREALLDVAAAEAVPRQRALLEWLVTHLPPGADDDPALCMGDARIVNCLIDGTEVRALVDFEVAYLGNPAADVGYSLFMDGLQRRGAEQVLPGAGDADEAWDRWATATGRDTSRRDYWTAFGAMVLAITATRALVQWGLAGPDLEASNPLVAEWEAVVDRAAPDGVSRR